MTASEANRRFSELLRDVVGGDSFTVTSHGKPVARVQPIDRDGASQSLERLLERLDGLPIRVASRWTRESLYE